MPDEKVIKPSGDEEGRFSMPNLATKNADSPCLRSYIGPSTKSTINTSSQIEWIVELNTRKLSTRNLVKESGLSDGET